MHELWAEGQRYYASLQRREQQAVQFLAVILTLGVLIEVAVLPSLHWRQRVDRAYTQNLQAAQLLQEHRLELARVAAQEQALAQPFDQLLSQAAAAVGMPAPASESHQAGLQVIVYKGVAFDTMVALLRRLQAMGLNISHLDIHSIQDTPGMVDAELSIEHAA